MKNQPLVSIIIRTCGRPNVLEKALDSVIQQSYRNIQIVIIEDGKNISEDFIQQHYAELNIKYFCSGKKQGRCWAGNCGLQKAEGKYCNFLDDDDILLPGHVETLVEQLKDTGYRAAYAIAEEQQIKYISESKYVVKRKLVRYRQPFNRLLLCYMNYIPIQSIMFERSLYEELGGLDETLDVLEDWDLWLRYALENDFLFVPQLTSVYFTPYKSRKKQKRESHMKIAEKDVVNKHRQYNVTMNALQINQEMDYILNVFNKKGILFYMQKIRNFLLYRDI